LNKRDTERAKAEYKQFLGNFDAGTCYICGNSLSGLRRSSPCPHWLLRPAGFEKGDFALVAKAFGFFQIQSFLRWVASTEAYARNINDLREDGPGAKLFAAAIRYRNLEWSFSCSESDYLGHSSTQATLPHYHLQMRVDQQQFINYGDFHLPFQ
jgi:hypothetical protein